MTASPSILMLCGYGINRTHKSHIDEMPTMTAHYGGQSPWNHSPPLYHNAWLEATQMDSDGIVQSAGDAPFQIEIPSTSDGYDVLLLPDGDFNSNASILAHARSCVQSFIDTGKVIYAYGNGVESLLHLNLTWPGMNHPVHITGYPNLAHLAQGHAMYHFESLPVGQVCRWQPEDGNKRSISTLRIVTS